MIQVLCVLIAATGCLGCVMGYAFLGLYTILGKPMFSNRKLSISCLRSPSFWFVLIFGFLYALIGNRTISGFTNYCLAGAIAYYSGWLIIERTEDGKLQTQVEKWFLVLICGAGIHSLLNLLTNMGAARLDIIDFFTRQRLSATCAGANNTLIFSLFVCILIISKQRTAKILGTICFGVSLAYALLLASRTQFVILGIAAIVTLAVFNFQRYGLWGCIRFILIIFVLILIAYLAYTNNVFGIADSLNSTNLFLRLEMQDTLDSSDSVRVERFMMGIKSLFQNIMGNPDDPYYHNMFLDVGRKAGLFPTIFLLLFTLRTMRVALRIFSSRILSLTVKCYSLLSLTGILLNCMVEPVMEGVLDLFILFVFISGMVESVYRKNSIAFTSHQ